VCMSANPGWSPLCNISKVRRLLANQHIVFRGSSSARQLSGGSICINGHIGAKARGGPAQENPVKQRIRRLTANGRFHLDRR